MMFQPRTTRFNAQRGYTMIQIMAVALVTTAIVGASIPMLDSAHHSSKLRASAEALISEIQLAKMKAVNENVSVTLSINAAGKTFQVSGQPTRYLANSVSFGGSPPSTLTFNSRGRLSLGSSQTITLQGKNNRTYSLTINPSGRVSLN